LHWALSLLWFLLCISIYLDDCNNRERSALYESGNPAPFMVTRRGTGFQWHIGQGGHLDADDMSAVALAVKVISRTAGEHAQFSSYRQDLYSAARTVFLGKELFKSAQEVGKLGRLRCGSAAIQTAILVGVMDLVAARMLSLSQF
jgi:hypothetical protein